MVRGGRWHGPVATSVIGGAVLGCVRCPPRARCEHELSETAATKAHHEALVEDFTNRIADTKAPAPAPVEEVEVAEEPITVSPDTIRARVKGTWRMSFNGQPWDFVDGQHYDLPPDLYRYLRGHENIYDTL